MKFESVMKKADETLLTHFDTELSRLKRATALAGPGDEVRGGARETRV